MSQHRSEDCKLDYEALSGSASKMTTEEMRRDLAAEVKHRRQRGCRGRASKKRHREAWLNRIGAAYAHQHSGGELQNGSAHHVRADVGAAGNSSGNTGGFVGCGRQRSTVAGSNGLQDRVGDNPLMGADAHAQGATPGDARVGTQGGDAESPQGTGRGETSQQGSMSNDQQLGEKQFESENKAHRDGAASDGDSAEAGTDEGVPKDGGEGRRHRDGNDAAMVDGRVRTRKRKLKGHDVMTSAVVDSNDGSAAHRDGDAAPGNDGSTHGWDDEIASDRSSVWQLAGGIGDKYRWIWIALVVWWFTGDCFVTTTLVPWLYTLISSVQWLRGGDGDTDAMAAAPVKAPEKKKRVSKKQRMEQRWQRVFGIMIEQGLAGRAAKNKQMADQAQQRIAELEAQAKQRHEKHVAEGMQWLNAIEKERKDNSAQIAQLTEAQQKAIDKLQVQWKSKEAELIEAERAGIESSLRAQREVVEVRRWAVDIERKLKESTAKVKKLETELVRKQLAAEAKSRRMQEK